MRLAFLGAGRVPVDGGKAYASVDEFYKDFVDNDVRWLSLELFVVLRFPVKFVVFLVMTFSVVVGFFVWMCIKARPRHQQRAHAPERGSVRRSMRRHRNDKSRRKKGVIRAVVAVGLLFVVSFLISAACMSRVVTDWLVRVFVGLYRLYRKTWF